MREDYNDYDDAQYEDEYDQYEEQQVDNKAVRGYRIVIIILAVMAMVFRNLYLIFKKSENGTPFQKDNIRMMKEIGIFSIAVPVIGFIMSIIVRLVTGVETAEISIDMGGIFMGIIVLCLTQYFIHGANLEKDVDGLL